MDDVLKPAGAMPLWFAEVDKDNDDDLGAVQGRRSQRARLVEINVRRTVFYPAKNRHQLHHRARLRHAARGHPVGAADGRAGRADRHALEQGLDHREQRRSATPSAPASPWASTATQFDNTSQDTAEGYVKTIERGLARGWNKDTIGGHVVRDNTVSHCEQAGIVGSLGAAFSAVTDNTIHDIHVRRLFTGAEMAGIKFHGAIDVEIAGNHIYRTVRGLWLDWMAQGTRVSGNLFHDNMAEDLFVEVDHGPFLVDNNVFLSPRTLLSRLARRSVRPQPDRRGHPEHRLRRPLDALPPAHDTAVAGMHDNPFGDDKYINNLFVGPGDLSVYDKAPLAVKMEATSSSMEPSRRNTNANRSSIRNSTRR